MLTLISGFSGSGKTHLLHEVAAELAVEAKRVVPYTVYCIDKRGAFYVDEVLRLEQLRRECPNMGPLFIDNFTEGLDWHTSKHLTELLCDSPVEVIVATHNRDAINRVPLEHLVVCVCIEGEHSTLTAETHKALYADFKFIGLNNVDFLELEFWCWHALKPVLPDINQQMVCMDHGSKPMPETQ